MCLGICKEDERLKDRKCRGAGEHGLRGSWRDGKARLMQCYSLANADEKHLSNFTVRNLADSYTCF